MLDEIKTDGKDDYYNSQSKGLIELFRDINRNRIDVGFGIQCCLEPHRYFIKLVEHSAINTQNSIMILLNVGTL